MHILACFVTSGAFNSHVGKIGVEWLVQLPFDPQYESIDFSLHFVFLSNL